MGIWLILALIAMYAAFGFGVGLLATVVVLIALAFRN